MILLNKFVNLSRATKRMILFVVDIVLIALSLSVAFALRFGMIVPDDPIRANWMLFPSILVLGALTIWAMRLNHIKIHTVENNTVLRLATSAVFLAICAMALSFLLNLSAPRSVPLIFGAIFFMSSVIVHFLGRYSLELAYERQSKRVPVAIYGAGNTGEQLAAALAQNGENKPVCFIDDNRQVHGMMIGGLKVHPASALRRLIKKHGLKRVLVAMPSASSYRRKEILDALSTQPIEVMELPNVSDQVGNKSIEIGLKAKRLKDIATPWNPKARNPEVLKTCSGKTVFIAGAGGAIGSELAQQIIRFEPAKVVLFERNEAALLQVLGAVTNLMKRTKSNTEVLAKTGSIGAIGRLRHLLKAEGVDIVINAAHYGDPRLSESNVFDVVSTNVLGPMNLAEVAIEQNIEQLMLLASERVISPKHLVDQTQMLAEKLVMGLTNKAADTKVSFLRFGQTSGPVGSIVPLLEHQIRNHNSVTLPDPEMTRFFVTTADATNLILTALPQADVLHNKPVHLSKGEPRKVIDFVNQVIDMTGKGIRSENNPFGVEVKFSGLRPGEALHETCLCEDRCTPLPANPSLLVTGEPNQSSVEHRLLMNSFTIALEKYDEDALRHLLAASKEDTAGEVLQTA